MAWLPAAEQAAQAEAERGKPSQRELVLDRRRRQLVVLDDGLEVRRFSVAVGKPGWETPVGHFQVIELVVDPIWVHPATGQAIPPGAYTRWGVAGSVSIAIANLARVLMATPT